MGNAKSNPTATVPSIDRKRTTKRPPAIKAKPGDGVSAWQPPGPKSYTCIDMDMPSVEERGTCIYILDASVRVYVQSQ